MKCLLVSSGMDDNSEVGFHVELLNKILTTSRPSYESLPSADDTSDNTRSETSSNCSLDEDDCETLFDPISSNSSDSQSENSDDTARSIVSTAESQMIEGLLLYKGSSTTVLATLDGYFDWFTTHPSVSKSALSELRQFEHEHILPFGNNLPSSYEEALQFLQRPFMLDTVTHHVCPNDCHFSKNTSPRLVKPQ